jgi:plasmid stabilization system protein ParE
MAEVSWSARAEFDLEYHARRIAQHSVNRAVRWMQRVRDKVATLERLPEVGSPVEDLRYSGYRELIVQNYRIIYRFHNNSCEIIAIFRAEQDINLAFGSEAPS